MSLTTSPLTLTVSELERIARETNPPLAALLNQLLATEPHLDDLLVRVPIGLLNLTAA